MKHNQSMTVGEMIAAHHFRSSIMRMQAAEKAFAATDIGAAFLRFENALGNAWIADQREHISDRPLEAAWDKSRKARDEFRTLLDRLMEKGQ